MLRPRWLFMVMAISLAAWSSTSWGEAKTTQPRLVVVLSIDQFRGDYVARFEPYFGSGGFKRIQEGGFYYVNATFPTANTETGPGHSLMLTGAYAHRSGITQNNWFDANEHRRVYCVEDANVKQVGSAGQVSTKPIGSASPRNLLAGSVADELESATAGRAKTISVSLKDRAAVLMGGHGVDLALWMDRATGEFVSSTFYVEELPQWLVEFNQSKPADKWFQKQWALTLPPEEYSNRCTEDDFPAEDYASAGYESAVFPHTLGAHAPAPDKTYYTNLYFSPFGNDLVVDLVKEVFAHEALGQDDVPDLLTISFSSNDPIGHAFGPDSWEVMDASIKTDGTVAALLELLDNKIGIGKWTLFLTADHGVCDFPEVRQMRRIPASRVSLESLRQGLEESLTKAFGPLSNGATYVADVDLPWIALGRPIPEASEGLDLERMAAACVEWLRSQPYVAFAMTTGALMASATPPDATVQALRLSHFHGRAGDVVYALKPNYLVSEGAKGTGHGSAYAYDQYVPVMALGAGVRRGACPRPVSPAQIAPTVAILLGVNPPNQCEVAPLQEALLIGGFGE